MLKNQRHEEILEVLKRKGYVSLADLVAELGASAATVRRDLAYLEEHNLLLRTHGGAVTASRSTSLEPSLRVKRGRMTEAKHAIGRAAAVLVAPDETVLLDAGSTTWEVANCLPRQFNLNVVSNDLQILLLLADVPTFNTVDTGGVVRKSVYSLTGHPAEDFIRSLRVNWTFLGADAIDPVFGITNANMDEVPIKQAMIHAAVKVVVVADHTKFGRTAFARVGDLRDVHMVITDSGLSPELAAAVREAGVELRLVPVGEPPDGPAG
jgi:DeoR/GlpR family transcriptional regulator of sugar metabolism